MSAKAEGSKAGLSPCYVPGRDMRPRRIGREIPGDVLGKYEAQS